MSTENPNLQLVHEQQLYDRVFALTNALDQAREQRRQLDTDLLVAQIALERAQRSRAWRFGHRLSRLGRALTPRRRAAGRADALQTAAQRLSGLEPTADSRTAGLARDR